MFFCRQDTIDMQVLKDLKRCRSTVGRGPVPRHAIGMETALVGVRFSRGSGARGGQAPALRVRKGFSSPRAVREQALPNYGVCRDAGGLAYREGIDI